MSPAGHLNRDRRWYSFLSLRWTGITSPRRPRHDGRRGILQGKVRELRDNTYDEGSARSFRHVSTHHCLSRLCASLTPYQRTGLRTGLKFDATAILERFLDPIIRP